MHKFFINYPEWPLGNTIGLLFLRLFAAGSLLVSHGWHKLNMLFSAEPIKFMDPLGIGEEVSLGLATFAEVLCTTLILIGLLTRWALFPLIVNFLIIVLVVHAGGGYAAMEISLFYLVAFMCLLFMGPGSWSIDAYLSKRN